MVINFILFYLFQTTTTNLTLMSQHLLDDTGSAKGELSNTEAEEVAEAAATNSTLGQSTAPSDFRCQADMGR